MEPTGNMATSYPPTRPVPRRAPVSATRTPRAESGPRPVFREGPHQPTLVPPLLQASCLPLMALGQTRPGLTHPLEPVGPRGHIHAGDAKPRRGRRRTGFRDPAVLSIVLPLIGGASHTRTGRIRHREPSKRPSGLWPRQQCRFRSLKPRARRQSKGALGLCVHYIETARKIK